MLMHSVLSRSTTTYGPMLPTVVRIAAGLLAPGATPLLTLVLHQSAIVEIPFTWGVVAVMVVAGFVSGLLLRST